jgi:hypothetical protein
MSYKENGRTGKPRNAMFTEDQREYLKGDGSGYTDQNKRDYENAIKERVHNTLLDFSLLFDHWNDFEKWDQAEREKLFQQSPEPTELDNGIASMLALVYLENRVGGAMERFLTKAVRMAEATGSDLIFPADVDFNVDLNSPADYDKAIEKFRDGNLSQLSDKETRAVISMFKHAPILSSDEIDEIQQSMREHQEDILSDYIEAKEERYSDE